MMMTAALLLLVSVVYLVAAMIAPQRLVPGPDKTRWHAWRYGGAGVLVGLAIAALAPDSDAPARTALCTYFDRDEALTKEFGATYGRFASESLQAGNRVTVQGKAVIGPFLGTDGTAEGALAAIASLVTIPTGDNVEILDRVTDRKGKLFYKARWLERDAVGYINPASMSWLDRGDVADAYFKARDAWMKPRKTALQKDLFGAKGLDFNSVFTKSLDEHWTCGK